MIKHLSLTILFSLTFTFPLFSAISFKIEEKTDSFIIQALDNNTVIKTQVIEDHIPNNKKCECKICVCEKGLGKSFFNNPSCAYLFEKNEIFREARDEFIDAQKNSRFFKKFPHIVSLFALAQGKNISDSKSFYEWHKNVYNKNSLLYFEMFLLPIALASIPNSSFHFLFSTLYKLTDSQFEEIEPLVEEALILLKNGHNHYYQSFTSYKKFKLKNYPSLLVEALRGLFCEIVASRYMTADEKTTENFKKYMESECRDKAEELEGENNLDYKNVIETLSQNISPTSPLHLKNYWNNNDIHLTTLLYLEDTNELIEFIVSHFNDTKTLFNNMISYLKTSNQSSMKEIK